MSTQTTKTSGSRPEYLTFRCPLTVEASATQTDGAAATPGAPRFRMVAYSGGLMRISGFPHPVVVDLEGLDIARQDIPVRLDHSPRQGVGHTQRIAVESGTLTAEGLISRDTSWARDVARSAAKGFPWQASIGASVVDAQLIPSGQRVTVNGRTFDGPLHVVRKAILKEISFVDSGADRSTSARIAAQHKSKECDPMDGTQVTTPSDASDTAVTDEGVRAAQAAPAAGGDAPQLASQAPKPKAVKPQEAAPAISADAPAALEALAEDEGDPVVRMRQRMAAETRRIEAIHKLCNPSGGSGSGKFPDIEAQAIEEGWDTTRTELAVLRASRPSAPAAHSREPSRLNAAALEASLCLTAGLAESEVGRWYDDRTMEAALSRELRGAGLHTLMYEVIRIGGGHVRPGQVDNDMIRAAFAADRRLCASDGGFSTISLSGILSNLANKRMLAAYEAVESVVTRFCAETDHNDFKQVTRYRLTGNGVFQKVGPDGELKHTTLEEESYSNQVETYGRLITLTRQMLINDDLGAFLQIPRIIGRQSALKREEAVFELLLSNPAGFFSAGNRNYFEGVDSVLGVDGLTTAEQLFADQVDADGKPILVSASVLLVPTSLKVSAQQLMTETRVNETTTANKPKPASNPHAGKWQPVSSPYLNAQGLAGSSTTAWYLFANPADVAAIEIAYLRGRRVPTIESGETDFNTLGMRWRGYFDFGVAMQDHRAAVKSKGT